MTYDNTVPQGTQQISTTQPIIQANFAFLQSGIGQEHNFNAAGSGSDMYHSKASMPNLGLSPALPASTNGVYFVNSSNAFFYNGTNNFRLNTFQNQLTGTYTATSSSTFNDIVAVPANKQGIIILVGSGIPAAQVGTFISDASNCYAFSTRMKLNGTADDFPIELNNSNSALFIQGRRFSSDYAGPYTYKVFYTVA